MKKIIIIIFVCLIFSIEFLIFQEPKIKPDIQPIAQSKEIQEEINVPLPEIEKISLPIPNEKEYIYANLDKMEISIYSESKLLKTFPILSIRKIGSKFDTPKGTFKVLGKEKLHWSTIGNVWMPWSIHFYGNYFIHGWPYYSDNTPVSKGYSGGCIRLNDEDAKEIYEFSKKNTIILIE